MIAGVDALPLSSTNSSLLNFSRSLTPIAIDVGFVLRGAADV